MSSVRPPRGSVRQAGVERRAGHANVREVLERVLDGGVFLDASPRIAPGTFHLASVTGRVRIVSVETRLRHARPADFPPPETPLVALPDRAPWAA